MLIKIAKNGIESEWFQLTKKHHRTLLLVESVIAALRAKDAIEIG